MSADRSHSMLECSLSNPPLSHQRPNGAAADVSQLILVVLGAPKVGKTALVSQFLWQIAVVNYRPTVEECHWIHYDLDDGNELLLQVIDTSGSREFMAMRQWYAKNGDAFIVVFAVNDRESFNEAATIVGEIRAANNKHAPVLLIGNKIDSDGDNYHARWPTADADVQRLVNEANCQCYTTLSVKNVEMVERVFRQFIEQMRHARCGGGVMKKRRQSMPAQSLCDDGAGGGIDSSSDLATIANKRNRNKPKNSCAVQ